MKKKHIADQALILQQCGALLSAGLTFHESARMLAQESRSEKDTVFFTHLADEVSGGGLVSEVLNRWKWSAMAVTLIRVGEMSGSLAQACNTAARELSYRVMVQKKILGMMLYPACIFLCAAMLIAGIVGFVFPKILPVLHSMSGVLPLSTRIVLWSTTTLQHYGVRIIVAFVALLFVAYGATKKFPTIQRRMSVLFLKLPLVGSIVRSYTVAHICRIISILSRAHLDVVDCLDHAREATTNYVYRHALSEVRNSVVQGMTLSRSLATFPHLFPSTLVSMIAVAEQSGSLAEMSGSVSVLYESEYTASLERISKLIEPLLMIGLGLVVGFIAISIITPIYEITTHVQR